VNFRTSTSYQHRDTKAGGHITQDVTQGYAPEMFTLPKAAAGKYQVRVKYFAQDANRASTRTKVYATIYEGFRTPLTWLRPRLVGLTRRT
jgi:uncharacterized protein YfaP (DUF2135 family)